MDKINAGMLHRHSNILRFNAYLQNCPDRYVIVQTIGFYMGQQRYETILPIHPDREQRPQTNMSLSYSHCPEWKIIFDKHLRSFDKLIGTLKTKKESAASDRPVFVFEQ